jgi:hypothetical protein
MRRLGRVRVDDRVRLAPSEDLSAHVRREDDPFLNAARGVA